MMLAFWHRCDKSETKTGEKFESVMPPDLLEAKKRKETTQQAYDKMILEMQQKINETKLW